MQDKDLLHTAAERLDTDPETLLRRYMQSRNGHHNFSDYVNSLSDEALTAFAAQP